MYMIYHDWKKYNIYLHTSYLYIYIKYHISDISKEVSWFFLEPSVIFLDPKIKQRGKGIALVQLCLHQVDIQRNVIVLTVHPYI